MRNVKIVCTLGPATEGIDRLRTLIRAGLDVARLNFSHGTHEEHRKMAENLRAAAGAERRPIAILADLSGPKIRVGRMEGGSVRLAEDASIALEFGDFSGTAERVSHNYEPLAREVSPGGRILLDDGMLELAVESIDGNAVRCRIVTGGTLHDRKGMNLPGAKLSTPALTDKDRNDLEFAKSLGVDFFALSFVRRAEDIAEAKGLAGDVPVIAKIEKPEAVDELDAILDAADGVMVARGDLGVEAGFEKVPLIQKRIIREVKRRAKPVITATQMLNSMIENPTPTRAEVSDLANAVLDGTDAVMLSGETAVGRYPVEAVRVMDRTIREVESDLHYTDNHTQPEVDDRSFSNTIAGAVARVAQHRKIRAIAVFTASGRTAALVSAHRPDAAIVAFAPADAVLRRLNLFWGVEPILGDWVNETRQVVHLTESKLREHNLAEPGDEIAITYGLVIGDETFQTNMLKLWKVRES